MCRVIVAKSEFDYIVRIDDSMFEMNENPLPNGVNIYLGEFDDMEQDLYFRDDEFQTIPMRDWPDGLKENIVKRMEEMKNA